MAIITTRIAALNSNATPDANSAISNNGRWIAYIADGGNGKRALYLYDANSGQSSRILTPAGTGEPLVPGFSADSNKLVCFLNNDLLNNRNLYVYDLDTGKFQVARTSGGSGTPDTTVGDGWEFSISSKGQFLAFSAFTDNVITGDNNGYVDVAVKNLVSGEIRVVSTNSQGIPANEDSTHPIISRDGRFVIFESRATNLVDPPTKKGQFHLYSKDLQSGEVRILDTDANGKPLGIHPLDVGKSTLSNDGRKILFVYSDSTLKPTYYVKDIYSGELIDFSALLTAKNISGSAFEFSLDGRSLLFESRSGGVLHGDADYHSDIYKLDLQTQQLQLLTPHGIRDVYSDGSKIVDISDDGQTVLFWNDDPAIFGNLQPSQTDAKIYPALYISHLNGSQNSGGDDALIGTGDADQLAGGKGDDSYWVNHTGDTVVEAAGGGRDMVFSLLANFTLPPEVEELALGLSAEANVPTVVNANGTGNALDNRIIGNVEKNVLLGMGGNDFLDGGEGDDSIDGGDGNDSIYGGRGNDTISGGNGNDLIYGDSGNDLINGGEGLDVARFLFDYSSAKITKTPGNLTVQTAIDNFDTLQNIERIQFGDLALSLPGDTHAAQAYRIYQAAFNRTPDSAGLGFWVKQIDNGAALIDIARGFMQSSEFKILYGDHPANGAMVQKFYQNVLHRAPDAGGLAFWTDVLNTGRGTSEYVLAQFSESPENQVALTGVISAGFTFKLFA